MQLPGMVILISGVGGVVVESEAYDPKWASPHGSGICCGLGARPACIG